MKRFFEKYPIEPCESDALKMMHKHLEEAIKAQEYSLNEKDYLEHLAKLYIMISDFFEVKSIPISSMI